MPAKPPHGRPPQGRRTRGGCPEPEITTRVEESAREAWVEQISHGRGWSHVRLVLRDGGETMVRLRRDELEWLEVGVDQIVGLRG